MVFGFVWVRASFPRIRYDQLMQVCWTVLLPLVFAFIFLVLCIIVAFDAAPMNISLLFFPSVVTCVTNSGLTQLKPKPMTITDDEFHQWLVGFIDGEGNFYIRIGKDGTISFTFTIKLHIDDLKALEFIKSKLNCGSIQRHSSENAAYFRISGVNQIVNILLPILD
jgi:hypothetical protein